MVWKIYFKKLEIHNILKIIFLKINFVHAHQHEQHQESYVNHFLVCACERKRDWTHLHTYSPRSEFVCMWRALSIYCCTVFFITKLFCFCINHLFLGIYNLEMKLHHTCVYIYIYVKSIYSVGFNLSVLSVTHVKAWNQKSMNTRELIYILSICFPSVCNFLSCPLLKLAVSYSAFLCLISHFIYHTFS